jgi:predicted secreted hydrolase
VNSLSISHFAVSDLTGKQFHFTERADAGAFGFAGAQENDLRVWVGENLLEGTMERMHVRALDRDKDLDLILIPRKPLVLNGEGGYSRKAEESPLFASLYFSYTSMEAAGALKIGDAVFRVKGKGWFDRELSTRGLSDRQKGWDWFSIQLDDNREIMLYLMRNKDGTLDRFSSGTFVYESGRYRRLVMEEFTVKVLDRYTSKKTGARYPSRWEITIPSENLIFTVTSLMEDQEFLATRSTGNHYWEGTCKVEGTAKGRAYVEMTGY